MSISWDTLQTGAAQEAPHRTTAIPVSQPLHVCLIFPKRECCEAVAGEHRLPSLVVFGAMGALSMPDFWLCNVSKLSSNRDFKHNV